MSRPIASKYPDETLLTGGGARDRVDARHARPSDGYAGLERHRVGEPRRAHAREAAHALDGLAVDRGPVVRGERVVPVEADDRDTRRLEAQIEVPRPAEAAYEEPGPHEEDDGERGLGDQEQRAGA
jgi:hypothetical protein